MTTEQFITVIMVVGLVLAIAGLPISMLMAKWIAYGWFRGKQMFDNETSKKEKKQRGE